MCIVDNKECLVAPVIIIIITIIIIIIIIISTIRAIGSLAVLTRPLTLMTYETNGRNEIWLKSISYVLALDS